MAEAQAGDLLDPLAKGPEPSVESPTVARTPRNDEIQGLRAIAALSVLVTHVSLNAMGNRGPWGGLLARLDVGVAIFFVISGYLLYKPFARALLSDQPLPSLRRYVRHRLVRIVPAYWLVVLASFLFVPALGLVMPTTDFSAAPVGVTSVPFAAMFRFVTFTQIYWTKTVAGPFPQAWTLATEMSFYVFLPLLAWALARHGRRRAADRASRLRTQWVMLAVLVVVATAFRLLVVSLSSAYSGGANAATSVSKYAAWLPNHLDLFAVGMAMAVLAVEREADGPGAALACRLDSALARPRGVAASLSLAVGTLVLAGYGLGLSRTDLVYGRVGEFLRHGAYGLIAAALVAPTVFGREGAGGYRALLRTRPMVFLGQVSYGIYIWQIFVIGRWVSSPFGPGAPLPARHPGKQFNVAFWPTLAWTFGVTVAVATLTWYLVEKPWLRFKDRPLGLFTGGIWAVSVGSFALRLWSIGTATRNNPGNGDPFYYHAQANMIADGLGFGEPIQWLTQGRFVASAIHPPLFTLWLTPASLIGARGYLSHKTMAALAGTLVVLAAGLLGRRLAGDRAGLLAGLAVGIAPNLLVIDGTLWPEGLYTACVGFVLVLAYRWRDSPSLVRAMALGAMVGAAVLARGEAIALLPLLCLPLVISARRVERRWLVHGAVMAGVAVLVVMPWTIRNLIRFERPVPISTNSEEVLYYANCPDTYYGPLPGYWSFPCQQRERAARVARGLPADPPGDESQRAAGWGDIGKAYAKAHRSALPRVAAERFLRGWDLRYSHSNIDALQIEGRPRSWSERGLAYYRASMLGAVVGLVVLFKRRQRLWPLLSMLVMTSATFVAVYGHVRFRTMGDFVFLVCTAVAVDAALARFTRSTTAPLMTAPEAPQPDGPTASMNSTPSDLSADSPAGFASSNGDPDLATGQRRWWKLRPDWRSATALAVVGVVLALPLRALFRYQGPPMEEGFMLVFPERLLAGDMPHRDFLHLYGPGSLWALAAWFKVLGVSLTAERLFGLVQLAGIVFGVMALAWPWGRRVAVAAGVFGVLLTTTAIGLTALAWDGAVALLVAAIWVGLRARRWVTDLPNDAGIEASEVSGRARRLLVLSGCLAGGALLFRPDVIVAVTLGTLAMASGWTLAGESSGSKRSKVLDLGRLKRDQPLRWWLTGAVPVLALYLVHLALSGPGNVVKGMLLQPVFDLRGGRALPRPPSWNHFDGALQKVAMLRPQSWSLPALTSPQQAFVWFFLLPAVTLFVVGVGWWRTRREPGRWQARVVLTVGLVGVGLLPQAFQRDDTTHLAWVSCVVFAFLPAAVAEFLAHIGPVSWRRWSASVAAVGVALVPLFVIPHFTARTYLDLANQSVNGRVFGYPVRHDGRTFYLGSKEIAPVAQRMLDEIGPQTKPGQRLLVGTADLRKTPYSDAYLYFLLPELRPGTRYIEMDPGIANAPDSGLAREVANSDWLILSHIWDGWQEPNDSQKFGSDAPNQVVKRDFCPVGDYAPYFEVFHRCHPG